MILIVYKEWRLLDKGIQYINQPDGPHWFAVQHECPGGSWSSVFQTNRSLINCHACKERLPLDVRIHFTRIIKMMYDDFT